jgi:pimeloyl-ACP methyl ester carboxylesterase
MSIALAVTDRGSGPPVVLLHAFPLDHRMWQAQIAALTATHRVVAPDLRGFGRSPLGGDRPSMDVVADDVASAMRALGLVGSAVVGLSLGGYAAMALLRRHADLVGALVLVDTKAGADPEAARTNRERIADTLEHEGTVRVLLDEAVPGLVGPTTHAERPEVLAQVRAMIEEADPASAAWMQRAMAGRPDSVPDLEGFDGRALVVVGDEDGIAPPADAAIMRDALPHGDLVTLPRCGHLSALESPDALNAVLRSFLVDVEE